MKLIVKRKVSEISLKPSEFLLPLFEAVINAIEAIQESKEKSGFIKIIIERDTSQLKVNYEKDQNVLSPIKSFIIEDNGIGFNKDNFEAFNDAYTDHKIDKGGKGVGRFTILSAFKLMKITSSYQENGYYYEREFTFDTKNEVKEKIKPKKIAQKKSGSIVVLTNYLKAYYKNSNVSVEHIAEKLVEHCLLFYISKKMPKVSLIDDSNGKKPIILDKIFKKLINVDEDIEHINEKNEKFSVYFMHKYSTTDSHRICFCSNAREVENVLIKSFIPNLSTHLEDDNGKYNILVYIIGKYLDNNVFEVRNTFKFPKKSSEKDPYQKFSLEELIEFVRYKIEARYNDTLNNIEKQKLKDIENFILEEGGIEYRYLLNDPENFKNISPKLSKEKLDSELHRINFELEAAHKKNTNSILKKESIENFEEYEKELMKIVSQEHEFSIGNLAKYVVRRKVIIEIFNKFLELPSINDDYKYEKDIHNIIFQRGYDSDTIPFSKHNLWLLDEKLTFHTYISSDKQIRTLKVLDSDSQKKPDLAIFDNRYAFTSDDQFQSIIIFELKRPGLILTGDDRIVDKQVKDYFEELMKSKTKDYRGRILNIREDNPKFGYVLCEIDKGLEEYMLRWGEFKRTSSGTFYKYISEINLYIEVMTYKTMLNNAEIRHKAFFKQLGIDYSSS